MGLFFRARKKGKLKRIENKLFFLVEKKEKKEQVIDDYGRNLVLSIRDYRHDQTDARYRRLMKEAIKYRLKNERYY